MKSATGFTLIELLVVVIIIGILSAIALPSFLNQVSKARQAEAKTNIAAILTTQQAYYLEHQVFAENLEDLKLGISNTDNYQYGVYTPLDKVAGASANTRSPNLRSYLGVVVVEENLTLDSVICEALNTRRQYTAAVAKVVAENNLSCYGYGNRVGK